MVLWDSCWKDNLSFLCLGCFRLRLGLFCVLLVDEQGTSVGEFDKSKIVNSLLSISLYLFCIFLFIILLLCLIYCFRLILEGSRRQELKRVENMQIWQISTQRGNPGQTGWPVALDHFWQRLSAAAPTIGKLAEFFLFQLYRHWATWHNMFWPHWPFKDAQNSSSRHSKSF